MVLRRTALTSSTKSPWIKISSHPGFSPSAGLALTPHANLLARVLANFLFSSTSGCHGSNPLMEVTILRLVRENRTILMTEAARLAASFSAAATGSLKMAFPPRSWCFFSITSPCLSGCPSSRSEVDDSLLHNVSSGYSLANMSGCVSASHSLHFGGFGPYSQYFGYGKNQRKIHLKIRFVPREAVCKSCNRLLSWQ